MAEQFSFFPIILSIIFGQLVFHPSIFVLGQSEDPAVYYLTTELICADGYPAQEHKIITDDGYILTAHRIPSGKRRPKVKPSRNHYLKIHSNYHSDFENCVTESLNETSTGVPVLLAHGLLMGSDGWVLQGPGYDLAYLLADAGFDVWLMNIRGNFYSRLHISLDPSNPKFWDFSFHENAYYDVPNTIDYILSKTQYKKLLYVGYSLGTVNFFLMGAIRPEYNSKILGFAALAPVAYLRLPEAGSLRRPYLNTIMKLTQEFQKRKIYEIFPRRDESINLGKRLCSKDSRFQDLCYDVVSTIVGYHSKLVLRSKLHLYLTHLPTGTSLKTLLHFVNNAKYRQLRKFDYGPKKNMVVYGRPIPPDYAIWNVTAPVALYYTDGDLFYDVKDEEYLRDMLPNVIDEVVLKNFNHADFIWSYRAKDLLYYRIVSLFEGLRDQYNRQSKNKSPKTPQ